MHKCHRKGHYQAQCFSKTIASTDELKVDMAFLGAVSDGSPTQWRISVQVGDKLLPFKMDTDAQVTAISEETFNQLHAVVA